MTSTQPRTPVETCAWRYHPTHCGDTVDITTHCERARAIQQALRLEALRLAAGPEQTAAVAAAKRAWHPCGAGEDCADYPAPVTSNRLVKCGFNTCTGCYPPANISKVRTDVRRQHHT